MNMERNIKLTAQLYETRDTFRRLWGAEYRAKIDRVIEGLAEQNPDVWAAATAAAIRCKDERPGLSAMFLVAGVEWLEPTPSCREAWAAWSTGDPAAPPPADRR